MKFDLRKDGITPIYGINENELTEFHEGPNEKATNIAPAFGSPQFGAALMNSRSVLPPRCGKKPATKPSPRARHAMAYIGDDKVLLFGGTDGIGGERRVFVHDQSRFVYTAAQAHVDEVTSDQ